MPGPCLNKAVPLYRSPAVWWTHTWYFLFVRAWRLRMVAWSECLLFLSVKKATAVFIFSLDCIKMCVIISIFHWADHVVTELLGYRHTVTPFGANGQGDQIQAIPLTGYRVTVTSAKFAFCSQPPGFYCYLWLQMLIWSGWCNAVKLQFCYHITYIGKMSYPDFILHVKSSDAPPLYVTEQLTPRRLVCSMTGREIQTKIHL